jgi:hypothetical protein
MWYWKRRLEEYGDACGAYAHTAGCGGGPRRRRGWREAHDSRFTAEGGDEGSVFGAGGLGVRRPLRFLAWRLQLSSDQVGAAARILERLKIERAQAAVDLRRSAADLAEALEASAFDRARADAARERRLDTARRVQEALARALEELHGILDERQRAELATLIRSGAIQL